MKKSYCLLTVLASLFCFPCMAEQSEKNLYKFLKNVMNYRQRTPQEKVYLHLDNNGYFLNESIWFKAYVVQADSLTPSPLSQALYVELLAADGSLAERKTLRLENGMAHGQFDLNHLNASGFYEIRAYTRAMLNWEPYLFSRVIPIFDPPKEGGNAETLHLYTPSKTDLKYAQRPQRNARLDSLQQHGVVLDFYPEGGDRIAGVTGRVAYRLTDKQGNPLQQAQCELYDADGRSQALFSPSYEGRGIFVATGQSAYVEVKTADRQRPVRFDLPAARPVGCVMTVEQPERQDTINVSLHANAAFGRQTLGLCITCRGEACYFDTLTTSPDEILCLRVPRSSLRDGINQFTLYTDQGNIVAERLVFRHPTTRSLQVTVRSNNTSTPFSAVPMEVEVRDPDGKPVATPFSIAIRDAATELAAGGENLSENFLLTSDLRGYIHQPGYYFAYNDSVRRSHLDQLLMVQGWRRYEWTEMTGQRPWVLRQPLEDGLLMNGRVLKKTTNKPVDGAQLALYMYTQSGYSMKGECKTDSAGNFAFLPEDFIGDWNASFVVRDKRSKRRNYRVILNRNFMPKPRLISPAELALATPASYTPGQPASMLRIDTNKIERTINLPEVETKAKQSWSRYDYGGGEAVGRRHATLVYDIEAEMRRTQDGSEPAPLIWDWLKEHNKAFDYDIKEYTTNTGTSWGDFNPHMNDSRIPRYAPHAHGHILYMYPNSNWYTGSGLPTRLYTTSTPGIQHVNEPSNRYTFSYKNKPARVYVNNEIQSTATFSMDLFGDEVKRIYIDEKPGTAARTAKTPEQLAASTSHNVVTIYVYTKPRPATQRGHMNFYVEGYTQPVTFYSPDYGSAALPRQDDLRRTLYWNPQLQTDETGKACFQFYQNAIGSKKLNVTIQGVTADGRLVNYE